MLDRGGFSEEASSTSGAAGETGQSGGEGGDQLGAGGTTGGEGAQGGSGTQGGSDASGGGGAGGKSEGGCLDSDNCDGAPSICDPQLAQCEALAQCKVDRNCASTEICLDQNNGVDHGACYTTCQPFASSCVAGQTCVAISNTGQPGVCLHDGPGAHLESCAQDDISTGCVPNYACYSDLSNNTFCLELCNFWNGGSCSDGNESCFVFGACDQQPIDSASIGSSCNSGIPGRGCGLVDDVVTGVCSNSLNCRQWCRVGFSDCGEGSCVPIQMSQTLGVCIGN